jgi:DNA-directed RNA polymerase specialized sigma24 family protein
MSPAMTAPPAGFTPYLIKQARLRASLLRISFGLGQDEWEDLRQELAMDCLRRLVNFDPARSDWRQFVHTVVRNHSCVLASRLSRRPPMCPLDVDVDADTEEAVADRDSDFEEYRESVSSIELQIDVRHVLAGTTPEQRVIARLLSRFPLRTVRRMTGLGVAQLDRRLRQIRAAFIAAGFRPVEERLQGGWR